MKLWLVFSIVAMFLLAARAVVQQYAVMKWENWKVGFLATIVSLFTWLAIAVVERHFGLVGSQDGKPVAWTWSAVGWSCAAGLVSTLGACASLWALSSGGQPGKISAVVSSYVAIAAVMSRYLFDETWTPRQVLAFVFIGVGLVLMGLERR